MIHLGFGIEFNQPAIIAEALAQAAIHEDWTGPRFLWPAENLAGGIGKPGKKTLVQILEDIRRDEKLVASTHWTDGNKMRDGVLQRAPDEMLKYAAQFSVSQDQLEDKLAEMINNVGKVELEYAQCLAANEFNDMQCITAVRPSTPRNRLNSTSSSYIV